MFDKLEDLVDRLDTLNNQLTDPDIVSDQNKFRKLMKEQSELTPIVEKYKEYKDAKQTIEDSLLMLEEENDEELREMAKEELNEAKATVEKTENELKILLLPKDPNDSKNVIVEIRAGAGGDEAALFAYEIYRMYQKYVDQFKWKVELMSVNENGIGGFKEAVFMITGDGAYSKMLQSPFIALATASQDSLLITSRWEEVSGIITILFKTIIGLFQTILSILLSPLYQKTGMHNIPAFCLSYFITVFY